MTRRSRREIEQELSGLTDRADHEGEPAIVYEHPDTGEWIDMDGRCVDPDACPLMMIVPTDDQITEMITNA
jgi:hypothetical protein